jgi:hypothetical protein
MAKSIATPQQDLKEYESLVNLWLAGEVNGLTTIDDLPTSINLRVEMEAGHNPKEVALRALRELYPGQKPSGLFDRKTE